MEIQEEPEATKRVRCAFALVVVESTLDVLLLPRLDMISALFLLVPLTLSAAPTPLAQEAGASLERWETELSALHSGDAAAIAEAHLAFRADPEAARVELEQAFRELAARPSAETLPVLIEMLRSFRALGPHATPSIAFIANSPFLLNEDVMKQWRADGTGEAVALRNDLWREMRLAIGATGRVGLERIYAGGKAEERTEDGVPYSAILNTILPNGAESMATVAEFAFSDDAARRGYGRHFASYAEDDLGPYLTAWIESEEESERDRALVLAGLNLPNSASFLCGLFTSTDDELRRGALTAMIRRSNPNLLDPRTSEYQGYIEWHGHRFPTKDRPFRVLDALRAEETIAAVARALEHEDEATRVLAAFLLMCVAEPGNAVPREFGQATSDASAAVRYWADEAVRRRSVVDERWLRVLSELSPAPEWESDDEFAAETEALQADAEAYAALEQTEDCLDAVRRLEVLSAVLHRAWPEDEDTLRHYELIRQRDMQRVIRQLDNEAFAHGVGYDALKRFGLAALPEFEADYLQDPRFTVGSPTFADRQGYLLACGRDALPLLTQSLYHWRSEGQERCERALGELDEEHAAVAQPIREALEAWSTRSSEQ